MSKTRPVKKSSDGNGTFKDFKEYWHFTKCLNQNQRDLIFASLPPKQQHLIKASYNRGGWGDVIMRDAINKVINSVKAEFNCDMLSVRCRVLSDKSVYVPRDAWDYFVSEMEKFSIEHSYFVFGEIRGIVCKSNTDVVLVVKNNSLVEE